MKKLVSIIVISCMALSVNALDMRQVRFHNEESDTTRINEILVEVGALHLPTNGEVIAELGRRFLGTPYVAHTLEGDTEMLTVNVDELDCTTFVETVLAMAMTLDEGRNSWRDFLFNLQNLRYRSGEINGYPSRLHYISDWAVDNIYRGNIRDVTSTLPKSTNIIKTIDFMSANASKYSSLADSANLARIKSIENGYRNCRIPYVKSVDFANKGVKSELKNGDVLAFVTNIKNLDFSHLGLVVIEKGEPYVMHASSSAGEVVISKYPLADFLKKNRQFLGARIFRLPER